MKHRGKRDLEKISVDRAIVEGLRSGKTLNYLVKNLGRSKGYVLKIRSLALEQGYVVEATESGQKRYSIGGANLPPFPEALFPLRDGRSNRTQETDQVLMPHLAWIKERFELNWTTQSIYEELPVALPRSNFFRFINRNGLRSLPVSRNVIELIHAPGECLQVDWGKLFDVVDPVSNRKKTIWIFIGVLGHSRYEMARVVEKLDFATTVEVLISMFEELGGVPRKVTCDNPLIFVKKASDYEPTLNPGFARLASYYGFTIEALPPYSPEKKGKVERMVAMKRRLFESFDLKTYSLEKAQVHINRKFSIVNERRHGTHLQKPIEVFLNEEATLLKSLPQLRYELETITHAKIRADGYVRYLNKYYRVDARLKGEIAVVVGNSTQVSIYCNGRLLELYERIQEKYISKACKDHYKEPWEKTLQDHQHYIQQARQIGGNAERFVEVILARGEGFVDTRAVWGLLTLNKKYQASDIDNASKSALELGQVNLKTIHQLLNIMAKPIAKKINQDQELLAQTMGGKFARPISEYKKHLRLVHSQDSEKGK